MNAYEFMPSFYMDACRALEQQTHLSQDLWENQLDLETPECKSGADSAVGSESSHSSAHTPPLSKDHANKRFDFKSFCNAFRSAYSARLQRELAEDAQDYGTCYETMVANLCGSSDDLVEPNQQDERSSQSAFDSSWFTIHAHAECAESVEQVERSVIGVQPRQEKGEFFANNSDFETVSSIEVDSVLRSPAFLDLILQCVVKGWPGVYLGSQKWVTVRQYCKRMHLLRSEFRALVQRYRRSHNLSALRDVRDSSKNPFCHSLLRSVLQCAHKKGLFEQLVWAVNKRQSYVPVATNVWISVNTIKKYLDVTDEMLAPLVYRSARRHKRREPQ